MSDSDDDLIPDLHSEITGMHTQRPNKNTYMTGFSTKNHTMTSTFNKQNLFNERHNYRGKFDQRSMCFRRETSPMSLRSFPDSRMQNCYNSSYTRGLSSQRSVLNGRSRSPMSIRSIDSNATVSAADIALAFKNENFNKYELKLIKEAYTKFMKNRIRKRIEKRRNLKLFLKSARREFGDDSGEHGSDSSMSSDDCRSTRTAIYKENLPQYRQRPLTIDTSSIRNTTKKTNMYEDCTENIKQKPFKNMLAVNAKINTSLSPNRNISIQQNKPQLTLKDRFAKGNAIKLPSKRFNKPGLKTNHSEGTQNICNAPTDDSITRNNGFGSNSENEEIFSEVTVRENAQKSTALARKRNLEGEDPNNMNTKRKKISTSPIKYKNESLVSSTLINTHNDFIFKKPQMPVRRSVREKNTIFTDKLISKSAQPLDDDDDFDPDFNLTNKEVKNPNNASQQNNTEIVNVNETEKSQKNTEVSLNPSFIKRKLFSQQFDFKDKKNLSLKNVDPNSPQTKLHAGENYKPRKVATSQTCLNREILEEENVLDLINKIVPIEQMNTTDATHKEDKTKSQDGDQWDVTSVISMCNNDDISETFTDEEIFKTLQNKNENKSRKDTKEVNNAKSKKDREITENKTRNRNTEAKINETKKDNKAKIVESQKAAKNTQCAVVLDKLDLSNTKANCDQIKTIQSQNKKTVSSCVRSFWDTDFESDVEERPHFTLSNKIMNGKDHQNNAVVNNTLNFNKRNGIKGTILNVRNSQSVGVNSSVRSDRNRDSQRKNLDRIHKASVDTDKCNKNCKASLTSSVTEEKRKAGRPKHNDTNGLTPARKGSKETCYKQKATDVNNVKKNGTIRKTRILTPRKVNENKRQSSPKHSDSSFNCSNLSISLRIRKQKIDYKSMLKK